MKILSNQFNILLTQYQNTYQDFVNVFNSNDKSFTSVDNSSFVSSNNINTIQNSSIDNCRSSCSSTQKCSGATFDNNENTCTLSSGNGNIVTSQNQTAIVKKALYYSNQLQKINEKLLNTNNLMMNLANGSASILKQTQESSKQKSQILQQNYNTLEEEREQIAEIIREYETLNSAYENETINLTSNYYTYIVYLLIVIFLAFLLFKFTVTSEQKGGGEFSKISPFIFVFLGFIIIFNSMLKK